MQAPRDKLVCVLNCCRVINNLLHAAGNDDNEARGKTKVDLYMMHASQWHAAPDNMHCNTSRYRISPCPCADLVNELCGIRYHLMLHILVFAVNQLQD